MRAVHRFRATGGVLLVAVLVLLSLPIVAHIGLSTAAAASTSVTVTGASPAWDPLAGQPLTSLPTVTVSQTEDLVDQVVHVSWTNFSPSSNDLLYSSAPTPPVTFQPGNVLYPVEVVECRNAAPTHSFLDDPHPDCYSFTPGAATADHGVGNAIQTTTGPDGSGFADIHVETSVENDFLGCDVNHPCSIAVVPNWGGDQNEGQAANCADHSNDFPSAANGYNYPPFADAADDHLGAACSWADRLVVPIHFAPTPSDCPSRSYAFAAAGSPMLARAMVQWQAGWCSGSKALTFDYDSGSNEDQARSSFLAGGSGALTSSTDVAMVTEPATGAAAKNRHFTYAPLATTAIVISYLIDDPRTGTLVQNLRLNARLVAKLLTQSYALLNYNCSSGSTRAQSATCDPAVLGNPDTIFDDPEFLALNPQVTSADFPTPGENGIGAFLPTVAGGNSDLTYELTRWIADDPDAASFLAGKPDPWGMTVNTYYRGIDYPVHQFLQLDPGYTDPSAPRGNGTMQNAWQPVSGLASVGNLLVSNTSSALSNSVSACAAPPCPYPKITELAGNRALFAIMDAGQAAAYAFPVAQLVNPAGVAVAPTTAALSAGVGDMHANGDRITEHLDGTSTDRRDYPLTVVDYAMVPTCGLRAATSSAVARFLGRVSQAQIYGLAPGQLAPGYLALTHAQLAQTASAATAVSTQSGCPARTGSGHSSSPSSTAPAGGGNGSGGGGGVSAPASTGQVAAPTPAGSHVATPVAEASPTIQNVAYGVKSPDQAGVSGAAMPLLLALGAALVIGGPGVYLLTVAGGVPALRRFVGRVVRR